MNSVEWREGCRCLSRATTLLAHIVLQKFERIFLKMLKECLITSLNHKLLASTTLY
jgi:hypothetical protein